MTPLLFAVILRRREDNKDWNKIVVEDAISNEFIKQHYAGLHHLLLRRIRDASITEEILQEAVATTIAHSRAGRVSDPQRLGGYVYRVALNLYRNYCREYANRPGVHATEEEFDQLPAQRVSEAEAAMDDSIMRHVVAVIESLPTARDREIVRRFYLNEEDKDEICRSLALTPPHFDRVTHRARQRLRALLEARGLGKSDFFSVLLSLLH